MDLGDDKLPKRFWAKVEVNNAGCWVWVGSYTTDGYGMFSALKEKRGRGKGNSVYSTVRAHRYAYMIARDLDYFSNLQDFDIHHVKCKTRGCVNPDHLTHVDRTTHRYGHAKNRTLAAGACSGTSYCMCELCCQDREAEQADEVPF